MIEWVLSPLPRFSPVEMSMIILNSMHMPWMLVGECDETGSDFENRTQQNAREASLRKWKQIHATYTEYPCAITCLGNNMQSQIRTCIDRTGGFWFWHPTHGSILNWTEESTVWPCCYLCILSFVVILCTVCPLYRALSAARALTEPRNMEGRGQGGWFRVYPHA